MKTKQTNPILFLLLLAFLNCQCFLNFNCITKEGNIESRIIDIESVEGFSIHSVTHLILKEGSRQEIVLETYPNIADKMIEDSYVRNGVYHLNIDGCVRGINENEIRVTATIPKLASLNVSGSGSVENQGTFRNVESLNISVSGSGNIQLNLGDDVENILTAVSGSGEIDLKGETENFDIRISGSGKIRGLDLISQQCKVSVSGSGNCAVFAEESLGVAVSGSGNVCYQGNAKVQSNISGSGNVGQCE